MNDKKPPTSNPTDLYMANERAINWFASYFSRQFKRMSGCGNFDAQNVEQDLKLNVYRELPLAMDSSRSDSVRTVICRICYFKTMNAIRDWRRKRCAVVIESELGDNENGERITIEDVMVMNDMYEEFKFNHNDDYGAIVQRMTDYERSLLRMRGEGMTLQQIGDTFGCCRERIRQQLEVIRNKMTAETVGECNLKPVKSKGTSQKVDGRTPFGKKSKAERNCMYVQKNCKKGAKNAVQEEKQD